MFQIVCRRRKLFHGELGHIHGIGGGHDSTPCHYLNLVSASAELFSDHVPHLGFTIADGRTWH